MAYDANGNWIPDSLVPNFGANGPMPNGVLSGNGLLPGGGALGRQANTPGAPSMGYPALTKQPGADEWRHAQFVELARRLLAARDAQATPAPSVAPPAAPESWGDWFTRMGGVLNPLQPAKTATNDTAMAGARGGAYHPGPPISVNPYASRPPGLPYSVQPSAYTPPATPSDAPLPPVRPVAVSKPRPKIDPAAVDLGYYRPSVGNARTPTYVPAGQTVAPDIFRGLLAERPRS